MSGPHGPHPGDPGAVAVILAAGFGTRLAPLTDVTPKPLLHVGGEPIATHLVRGLGTLASVGLIVVVVNARHPDQFEQWRRTLTRSCPVELVNTGAFGEAERRGAVADLDAATASVPDHSGRWLVVAGDNLVAAHDLRALDQLGGMGTDAVLCRDVGLEPSGSFGEVVVDAEDRITGFREKPDHRRSPLASTCTYALGPPMRVLLRKYLAAGGDPDSPGSFIAWHSARTLVRACMISGDYYDIGTPENLADARSRFDGQS